MRARATRRQSRLQGGAGQPQGSPERCRDEGAAIHPHNRLHLEQEVPSRTELLLQAGAQGRQCPANLPFMWSHLQDMSRAGKFRH